MKVGQTVWHTNFKCKVKIVGIIGKGWYSVKLPQSGGYMDTQLIETYKNQELTQPTK